MPRWLKIIALVALAIAGLIFSMPLGTGTAGPARQDYSSEALNALVASMRDSHVDTGTSNIKLQGVTAAGDEWTRLLDDFRESVADGVDLTMDVFVVDTDLPLMGLCSKIFAEVVNNRVRFGRSGIDIRNASRPLLDRIAEFTRDCRQSTIDITGHSDNTGNESYNKFLSKARAQAVADYLLARGASAAQLHVTGAGSDFPIADNATPQGREQNRRIEFTLRSSQ